MQETHYFCGCINLLFQPAFAFFSVRPSYYWRKMIEPTGDYSQCLPLCNFSKPMHNFFRAKKVNFFFHLHEANFFFGGSCRGQC